MPATTKPLDQQVVVVMGASSGIGRETAKQLAARGAAVVVAARSEPGLRSLVAEIEADGGRAVAQVADTADYAAVAGVARRAVDAFGSLDTWVQAAGVTVYGEFADLEPEEIRRVVEVDLLGQAYAAHAAIPLLRASGGGTLVHISSMVADTAFPLQSMYSASKAGVKGLADAIRPELAAGDPPVHVCNVMPGPIGTPFFDKARSHMDVRPTAPPPVYDPAVVAAAIVRLTERPQPEVAIGSVARLGMSMARVAPRAWEAVAGVVGRATQRSDDPSGFRSGNLFAPVPDLDTVRGEHFDHVRRTSAWTRLETAQVPLVAPAGRAVLRATSRLGRRIARTGSTTGEVRGNGTVATSPASTRGQQVRT